MRRVAVAIVAAAAPLGVALALFGGSSGRGPDVDSARERVSAPARDSRSLAGDEQGDVRAARPTRDEVRGADRDAWLAAGGGAPADASSGSARAAPVDALDPRTASVAGHASVPLRFRGAESRLSLHVTRRTDLGEGPFVEASEASGVLGPDGRYAVEGLGVGEYALRWVEDGEAVSETRRVFVEEGARVRGVDFDFVPRESVRGEVESEATGEPVEGAEVRVVGEAAIRTDPAGRFVLADLPEGASEVLVTHPDHAPARVKVSVRGGTAPVVAVALTAGAEVSIVAAGADGAPAAGVRIVASNAEHHVSAVTDRRGVARLRGLRPLGRYAVDALSAEPVVVAPVGGGAPLPVSLAIRRSGA